VRPALVVALALAIAPAASAGWIPVLSKRACGPLPAAYVCSMKTQVSFGYPASWNAFAYNDGGLYVRSLIWISTEPFRQPCTSSTDGVITTVTCRPPVALLRPNGIAAAWFVGGLRGLNLLPGKPATIAGLPAKIEVVAGGCPQLGGDELIAAWIETNRERAPYQFRACLRGPDLSSSEAAVQKVLASARLPYG
jgi:hypothetical protein